ncbi:MAG: TIGR04283 family arsenosugar biosynthesis glycosyltransferase [Betaproteobacteria bacterium]|nr:TIGR04283 family arsenosugar biosynthesis glycosyltransferase [Betaproteobacteria bacterium]
MRLSIVIPAYNEAAGLPAALLPLQAMRARGVEIVLADGGSSDDTREVARPWVDRVITASKGRARQMNAGAATARGDTLLFLHADSLLPPDGDEWIAIALANGKTWGRFDIRISGRHFFLPVIAWFINRRSRLTGIATGDQGLFATRDAWQQCGGFPDQPLMEDVEFCKRMKRVSPPARLPTILLTSGRRWEQRGVWRTIWLMWRLRLQYFLGADPASLHASYYGK